VGLREVGLLCDEGISLLSEKQLASQIKDSESVNDTQNSTNFVRAVGTMAEDNPHLHHV
jgi:hypothetical protein